MRGFTGGVLAEFDRSEPMVHAAVALKARGYRSVEAFTPYPVPHLDTRLGLGRTRLPLVTLIAGLSGACFAYWLQWYVNAVNYPLQVGGRPPHSAPPFILITFETTVLFASCAAFVATFLFVRLPRYWHPVHEIDGFERATVDRFWVGVPDSDPAFDPEAVAEVLGGFEPLRIVRLEHRP